MPRRWLRCPRDLRFRFRGHDHESGIAEQWASAGDSAEGNVRRTTSCTYLAGIELRWPVSGTAGDARSNNLPPAGRPIDIPVACRLSTKLRGGEPADALAALPLLSGGSMTGCASLVTSALARRMAVERLQAACVSLPRELSMSTGYCSVAVTAESGFYFRGTPRRTLAECDDRRQGPMITGCRAEGYCAHDVTVAATQGRAGSPHACNLLR